MKKAILLLVVLLPLLVFAADTYSVNWGTTAYGQINDTATLDIGSANNATFEFWIYPTAQPTGNAVGAGGYADKALIAKWQASFTSSYYIGYGYDAISAKQICMWMNDGTGNRSGCVNIDSINNNTWGYIAVVYDDSAGSFEVFQGNESTCPTSKGTATGFLGMQDGTSRVQVGHGDNVTGTNFSGQFDEVRIWRSKRTSTELNDNWTPGSVSSGTNLIDVWRFENDLTEVINSNTLTGINSPTFNTTIPSISASCGSAYTPKGYVQLYSPVFEPGVIIGTP